MNILERYIRRIVRQELANAQRPHLTILPNANPTATLGVPAYSGRAPEGSVRVVAGSNAKGRPSGF